MTGARVLLAHGNADCITIYSSVLAFDGFVVECVGSVTAALAALASAHFDVVITDLFIPGTGEECLIRAMRASTALAHVPVVILTAWATPQYRTLAFDLGAERFLPVPVKPKELTAIIADVTGSLRLGDAPILPTSTPPERPLANGI